MLCLADWAWLTAVLAGASGEGAAELPGMEVDSTIASMIREAVSGCEPAQAPGGGGQRAATPVRAWQGEQAGGAGAEGGWWESLAAVAHSAACQQPFASTLPAAS